MIILAALASLGARAEAAQPCNGDCNYNGAVGINELVLGVNISLDSTGVDECEAMDANGSLQVEINELISAVSRSLEGCPPIPCEAPPGGRCVEISPGPNAQDELLGALIEAQPHDVIFLKEGQYDIDGELSLTVDDVAVQGEGMRRTVLNFSQNTAAQGLLVTADRFRLEDIGLEDVGVAGGRGDLVKIFGSDGVTIRGVRTEWTNGPSTDNGAYGLYPVQSRDVLIEKSVVIGASDAGIYVGQSRNIIVRNNRVEFNVAGIEIENSTDADVYNNVATNNTGGVLVFNLPGPQVQDGRRTRVFNNKIYENNTPNFGAPGSSVSGVPTGMGAMVLANDEVEIFDNEFRDNDSTHILLVSYNTAVLFGQSPPNNPDFDPFSETVYIHGNTLIGGGTNPPDDLDPVVVFNGGLPLPQIIYDGDRDPDKLVEGELPASMRTCIQDQAGATFLNVDYGGGFANVTHDIETMNCSHDALPPAAVGEVRHIEILPGPNANDDLLMALIEAQPGDDILLRAGTYDITNALSLQANHVTLRGEGIDQTILNLAGLTGGGEGLLVQANDFTIQDLAFENAPGDQLKILGADGVRIRRVRAEWTNGADTDNGAYGLYPVACKDVLIEDSVVKGASDAGIYVGQSRNIIVRRNHVELNVAGIEIENSTGADVYENIATNNTGGILVFNLPNLPVYGERTRVFDNEVFENNTDNFAPEGNIVGGVPKGTGILVNANDKVEITGNAFRDNDTSQITVISYNTARILSGLGEPSDPNFDPFTESPYVHGNTYDGGGTAPPSDLDGLVTIIGGLPVPQVVFDGDIDPAKLVEGALPEALRTCIQDPDATFINLDVPHSFVGISRDVAPYNCTHDSLTPIAMAGVQ